MSGGTTLAEKVWDSHVVHRPAEGPDLLYIDLHLTHEATSPQAFDGLRLAGREVRRPELTLALEDHNVPTDSLIIEDPVSRVQIETLRRNCQVHGIELYSLGQHRQGIVHVVAPALGLVQPGMTVVCGDSHTSTHGAFGALAFGIGTSDVEHVLATQTLALARPRAMAVEFAGAPGPGTGAKDLILALIAQIGPNGAQGHLIEYRGEAVRALSMESRMTMCNMSIEAGARAGLVAPDEITYAYLSSKPHAPKGSAWNDALACWRTLRTDESATFDAAVIVDVSALTPLVTWGTNPVRRSRWTAWCPILAPSAIQPGRPRRGGPSSTWTWLPGWRCARSASTPFSSGRAPTAGSRTCAPRRALSAGARWPPGSACWWYRARWACGRRPRKRGCTRCSRRREHSGGCRAARCAWA